MQIRLDGDFQTGYVYACKCVFYVFFSFIALGSLFNRLTFCRLISGWHPRTFRFVNV